MYISSLKGFILTKQFKIGDLLNTNVYKKKNNQSKQIYKQTDNLRTKYKMISILTFSFTWKDKSALWGILLVVRHVSNFILNNQLCKVLSHCTYISLTLLLLQGFQNEHTQFNEIVLKYYLVSFG